MQQSLFDPVRRSDPATSKRAAAMVTAASPSLLDAIVQACARAARPLTQHEIAEIVVAASDGRWQSDSIRTAVARAERQGLVKVVGTVCARRRSYQTYEVAK